METSPLLKTSQNVCHFIVSLARWPDGTATALESDLLSSRQSLLRETLAQAELVSQHSKAHVVSL